MSEGQLQLLEYGFRRLDHEQWTRVERTLGTFWEWTDVYNSKTGRPLEEETPVPPGEMPAPTESLAESEMRLPLALVLKPELLQLIRKRLRPPAHLRREGTVIEGGEMSKQEFLETFGAVLKQLPQAARAIQEGVQPKSSLSRAPGPTPSRRPPPSRSVPGRTAAPTPPSTPRKPR